MPVITFTEDAVGGGDSILATFDQIFAGSPSILPVSATQFLVLSGSTSYTVTGTGFTTDGFTITGGTIQDIVVSDVSGPSAVDLLTFSALNLDVTVLQAAVAADEFAPFDAIENLFLNMDWVYNGNGGADNLSQLDLSSDGIPINLVGDDLFNLGAGDDDFFGGDGNDTVNGGTGNDTLIGGDGKDGLRGGIGNDVMLGGAQKDALRGGRGDDTMSGGDGRDALSGGKGSDRIEGGVGRDVLTGGEDSDTFVFRNGDGDDVIRDFDVTEDIIELANAASGSAVVTTSGADVIVTYGTDQIVVEGTTDTAGVEAAIIYVVDIL